MGKLSNQQLPVVQQHPQNTVSGHRCSGVLSRIFREFNFKCMLVLILTVAIFLSAVFWALPRRSRESGFDAKESIKLSATVQAYFKLHRSVSDLIPYIARLEYDVYEEIGVPSSKVAVLSMHQAGVSNWTNVVFGFLSDPMNTSINPVSLSVLKSSLIDLFLQQYNLTLTISIFGEPYSFEILKFPSGISLIPERSALIWQIPPPLFNFTLNTSICEIKENFPVLKEQLKLGLHLSPDENMYIQVKNKIGSTRDPPVTVDASVISNLGSLLPERLKQLAQIITGSPPQMNLGLDHSVFGKVKEVILFDLLYHSLHAPTPTPAPAPAKCYNVGPSMALSYSPASPPDFHQPPLPCHYCYAHPASDPSQPSAPSPQKEPVYGSSISNSPPPSVACGSPHCVSTHPPLRDPTPQISPSLSPTPSMMNGPRAQESKTSLVSSLLDSLPSLSSSVVISLCERIQFQWFNLSGLLTFFLLFWIS